MTYALVGLGIFAYAFAETLFELRRDQKLGKGSGPFSDPTLES